MGDTSGDGTRGIANRTEGVARGYTWSAGVTLDKITKQASDLKSFWSERNSAFTRFDELLALKDEQQEEGLESMVTNNALTLFSLAHFMVATSKAQRTVAIGNQGPKAQRQAGTSERATTSMWQSVNEKRLWSGEEPWQDVMAYWACLYGWYATLALTAEENGDPVWIAKPYDPSECFPEFGPLGITKFARYYPTTLGSIREEAIKYGTYVEGKFAGLDTLGVEVLEWWQQVGDEVITCIMLTQGATPFYIKEPDVLRGIRKVPILCGPVGGTPSRRSGWMSNPGSVLAENERVYKDFNKWLSALAQLVKEHANAPFLAKNLQIEEEHVRPKDIRSGGAIITTNDPEAALGRLDVGVVPVDVFRLLTLVSSMEQRGGFPDSAYGNLMFEISGFGISQLLQAADRRVGPQARKLSALDELISTRWLKDFRDNEFKPIQISGFEGNSKSFIEDFRPKDVPKKFKLSTNIPIRIGSDMMSRIAILRQAIPTEQLLDLYTGLDEIMGMDDPTLIMDRISEDKTRAMLEPMRMAINLKAMAIDLRSSRKPGAEEVAQMAEQLAESVIQQQKQAQGAQARQKIAPGNLPPEAMGQSPDRVKAALRMGPPPNQTREQQLGA